MASVDYSSGLLSPAPSETSTLPPNTTDLPTPRSHPLIPGSAKETALLNYLDNKITHVTARYAKSFAASKSDHGPNSGYVNFNQVIHDIEPVIDVVWVTATPAIQIPYLLTLAGHLSDYMPAFPFTPLTLRLVHKFDDAFSTILTFIGPTSYHVSPTDKVRIRSLVEESRLIIMNSASKEGYTTSGPADYTDDEDEETNKDLESSAGRSPMFGNTEIVSRELGRVYEKTISILGGDIGSLPPPESEQKLLAPPPGDDVEIIDL